MSLKLLLFAFLISGYVILSAWGLDVQNKVDSNNNRDTNGVLDKRDLKVDSTVAKYIDPPPEYYRGPPGSSSSYGSERDRIRDRDGYVVGLQRPPYAGSSGYDSRYPPPRGTLAPSVGGNRYGGFQDKIGYSGSTPYGGSSYSGSGYSGNGNSGSGYSGSSYGGSYTPNQIPYGQPIPIDFPNSYSGDPYPSAYGSNAGSFWSKKGFPGIEHFFPSADSSDFYYPGKSPFTKSLLVPLIGGAILGITAALVANPALLHLGMLSGKRRRRSTSATDDESHNGKQDEHAQTLAYRAYKLKKLL